MEKVNVIFINDVQVYAYQSADKKVYLPIKPLCKAIGLDYDQNIERTIDHGLLGHDLVAMADPDSPDEIEMCIPVPTILGWICYSTEGQKGPTVGCVARICYDTIFEMFFTDPECHSSRVLTK